jgi:hypothetical protein
MDSWGSTIHDTMVHIILPVAPMMDRIAPSVVTMTTAVVLRVIVRELTFALSSA